MSRALLKDAVSPLPYRLRDDVLSYASFVEDVTPDRAAQMGFELNRAQLDKVVFIAGVIYLRELVSGQLALAEAATGRGPSYAANTSVRGLRIGRDDVRRDGSYVARLRRIRSDINRLLSHAEIPSSAHRLSDAIALVAVAE